MSGLCFRCEYRARFLESGRSPRYECGQAESNKHGCYMYKPVKPVILKRNKGDSRPQFAGAMISARSSYAGEPDMVLNVMECKEGKVLYWDKPGHKV